MHKSRIPSPARSQSAIVTPRRHKPRGPRSVGSPARSNTSVRLSAVIQNFKDKNMDSFRLSPMNSRHSVLNDNTDIEDPKRNSWWKKLNDTSRDIMQVLDNDKQEEAYNVMEEYMDVEILSQEKKNDTVDLPESSHSESINSIVVPQRKLFTQKENHPKKKFAQLLGTRDSMDKLSKTSNGSDKNDKTIVAGTKKLFGHSSKPRNKPAFPTELLRFSPDKTVNKTAGEVKGQVRNLFGNRGGVKRKNKFADFIASESEDEPEIQPNVFGFQKKTDIPSRRVSTASRGTRDLSPSSSIADIEEDWKLLPSSTMVQTQLEAMMTDSPAKKAKLRKLSEDHSPTKAIHEEHVIGNKNASNLSAKLRLKNKNKQSVHEKSKEVEQMDEVDENLGEVAVSKDNSQKVEGNRIPKDSEKIVNKSVDGNSSDKDNEEESPERQNNNDEQKRESEADEEDEKQESEADEEDEKQESEADEEDEKQESEADEEDDELEIEKANNSQEIINEIQEMEANDSSEEVEEEIEVEENQEDEINADHENEEEDAVDEENEHQENKSHTNNMPEEDEENENIDGQNNTNHEIEEEDAVEKENESDGNINEGQEKETGDLAEVVNENNVEDESDDDRNNEDHGDEEEHAAEIENESRKIEIDNLAEVEENYESENNDNNKNEDDAEKENESQEIDNKTKEIENGDLSEEDEQDNEVENEEDEVNEDEDNSRQEIENQNHKIVNESQDMETDDPDETVEENNEELAVDDDNEEDEVDEENKSQEIMDQSEEIENESQGDNEGEESEVEKENESQEIMDDSDGNQNASNEAINESDEDEVNDKEIPNVTHDTTGRNRRKNDTNVKSPEAILHNNTDHIESFMAKGRNTSIRRTSMIKNLNIRPSLAPPRESTGLSDGTKNSSAEGSGWDSHRTTRKTLRQTFGRDFTPRKSLRALVMEKSAKRHTAFNDINDVDIPRANSTELPEASNREDYDYEENDHEVSKRTRQTTLEMYLQKIKKQNMEKKMKLEEEVRNSLKAPARDILNPFKVPRPFPLKRVTKPNKPKAKTVKSMIPLDDLPQEVLEDMKYKPPRRFQPSNASWITKRLYKFLESKLEAKYDYKARIRAEKLVETIYNFAKELRRHEVAPPSAADGLKLEMARLGVVETHFEFYQFFHDYMPREVRVKVVPDVVNKIPLPRHGVFTDILRGNTVQT